MANTTTNTHTKSGLVDFHTHILYGLDDGAKTLEESLKIINKLSELGFREIVLTPHYTKNAFQNTNQEKKEIFRELKSKLKTSNSNIKVHLGNEIFLDDDIDEAFSNKLIEPINKHYLLIELPSDATTIWASDMFYELRLQEYKIIISHPERCPLFQNDYENFQFFRSQGALFQSNYSSIIGRYGELARKTFIYMLRNNYVDLLGTDIHSINSSEIRKFPTAERKIKHILGRRKYSRIHQAALEILNEKD